MIQSDTAPDVPSISQRSRNMDKDAQNVTIL